MNQLPQTKPLDQFTDNYPETKRKQLRLKVAAFWIIRSA